MRSGMLDWWLARGQQRPPSRFAREGQRRHRQEKRPGPQALGPILPEVSPEPENVNDNPFMPLASPFGKEGDTPHSGRDGRGNESGARLLNSRPSMVVVRVDGSRQDSPDKTLEKVEHTIH
eukprot:4013172-Alexandrium_andersonii.AAC.1